MSSKDWHRTFDNPIPLPDGDELRSSRDAGNYIAKLPKREHYTFAWRAAIETLMLVAQHGDAARIGVMRALYPGKTAQEVRREYRIVR
jgi:hypothetical protein